MNEKGEKTGKALGKHAINLYATGISNVHKLHQDIKNDPIIKDQMTELDCLLEFTFVRRFAPILGLRIQ